MEASSARSLLEAGRAAAADRVAALRVELDWLAGDAADPNGDDEHDPEGSTVGFERARVAALLAGAETNLEELDRALARLSGGSYARCEACGGTIAPARLEALPATRTCVGCATAVGHG
jgi:RNA polymerase-binding transcription factor DksA